MKKIISIILATAMIFTMVAVNTFAAYKFANRESKVIDNIECFTKGGYDKATREADAFSIMTSLRGNETVTLKSYAAIDIRYASGDGASSPLVSSEKTVSTSSDGIRTYVELFWDSTEVVSMIYYSHWYYADGEYVYGCTYNKDPGVNTL